MKKEAMGHGKGRRLRGALGSLGHDASGFLSS